uniref:Uncharacterized protein n=1 Tax=Anopheles farauti TaxID=69004 RepID=A0A182R034_9DIPT
MVMLLLLLLLLLLLMWMILVVVVMVRCRRWLSPSSTCRRVPRCLTTARTTKTVLTAERVRPSSPVGGVLHVPTVRIADEEQNDCRDGRTRGTNVVAGSAVPVRGIVQEGAQRHPEQHRQRLGTLDETPRLGEVLAADALDRKHLQGVTVAAETEPVRPRREAEAPVVGHGR